MARFSFVFLSAVLCSLAALGRGDVTTDKTILLPLLQSSTQNIQTQPSAIHEDTVSSIPTVTTIVRTNSATPAVPTSSANHTTTEASSPPTTSTSTTTTTPKPTPPQTTTPKPTPPPTTTPKPTPPTPGPPPPPALGNWTYTENNVTCIVVQFAAQLNVTYPKDLKNGTSFAYVLLNLPANATVVNGSCGAKQQWLELSWLADHTTQNNSMVLQFTSNATRKEYSLSSLNISLTPELFPNASSKNVIELYHGVEWQTPLATSYRCQPATQLNMTAETTNVVATLTLSRLQEEAFRTTPGAGFSAARECGGRDVPDAVPIAVGCALGGLVVVVLIAYLVGRRRSAARGYLSM